MASAGKLVIEVDAGTARLFEAMNASNAKLKDFGQTAQQTGIQLVSSTQRGTAGFGTMGKSAEDAGRHIVSSMQASSAALRVVEGGITNNIRAGERFISTLSGAGPILQSLFPLIGALSVGTVAVRGIDRLGEMAGLWGHVAEKESEATKEAEALDEQIQRIAKDMASINMEKFTLQFGPTATKATESFNTTLEAQKKTAGDLSTAYSALAVQLVKLQGLQESGRLPLSHMEQAGRFTVQAPLDDPAKIEKALDLLDAAARNAGASMSSSFRKAMQGLTPFREGITKAYLAVEELQKKSSLQSLQTLQGSADETQTGRNDETQRQNQAEAEKRKAVEQRRKAWAELRAADEAGLAADAETYKSNIGEQIKYWESRLQTDIAGTDQEGAIYEKLTQLRAQQEGAIRQVAEAGARVDAENVRKAAEQNRQLEALIQEAESLNAKGGLGGSDYDRSATVAKVSEIGAKSAGEVNDTKIQGQKLAVERAYGEQVSHTSAQQIAYMRQIAELEDKARQAKVAGLAADQAIVQKVKAEANARGDVEKANEAAVKVAELQANIDQQRAKAANDIYEAQTKIAETIKSQSLGGRLEADFKGIKQQIPGQLGGALAKGVFDGKNIGKDIRDSLKGIGEEMLGSVFKELIASLLLNTTATGTLSFATLANTISTDANTIWLAIKGVAGLLGLAEGGRPTPGVPYLVGEKGPELRVDDAPGQIIPNHMMGSYMKSRTGPSAGPSSSYRGGDSNSGGNHTFNIYESGNGRDTSRKVAHFLRSFGAPFVAASK